MNYVPRTATALALLIAVSMAAPVCSQTSPAAATSQAADEAAIRLARSTQTKALAANDIDRVVSYWTPDITIRRALGQTLTGAAEARKVIEPPPVTATPPAPPIIYQREAVSVTASSNWPLAFEEGRWSGHVGSADAPPILGGRYSAQWVKRDGKWLIRSEVFVALTCAEAACKYAAVP